MQELIDSEIHSSPSFKHLPRFDAIEYKGFIENKIQWYEVSRQDMQGTVLSSMIIRKDDKFMWESCDDLLSRSVKDAAFSVHGVYRYDLLGFDAHREINAFNFQELTVIIVNHSRQLECGQERLIKYCSSYGMLRKLSAQDWGKTVFNANVDVFNNDVEKLDLYIKKFFTVNRNLKEPVTAVINDQSLEPIFDKNNELQCARLKKMFTKFVDKFETPPEIYMSDKNGLTELVSELGF
jgi:hypothetical protein